MGVSADGLYGRAEGGDEMAAEANESSSDGETRRGVGGKNGISIGGGIRSGGGSNGVVKAMTVGAVAMARSSSTKREGASGTNVATERGATRTCWGCEVVAAALRSREPPVLLVPLRAGKLTHSADKVNRNGALDAAAMAAWASKWVTNCTRAQPASRLK